MHKFFAVLVAAGLLAACSSSEAPQQASLAGAASVPSAAGSVSGVTVPSGTQAAVRSLVERFGRQMKKISTLAPPDTLRGQLQAVYGDLLSPQLLEAWQAHPGQAVGRKVSSPWPRRIEIAQVACKQDSACRVAGSVDYVTSNELEHGGVFMRRPVVLQATHMAQGWRITAVHLAPAQPGRKDSGR